MKDLLKRLVDAEFEGIADSLNKFYADMISKGYMVVYETKAILSIGNIAVQDIDLAGTVDSICELLSLYTSRTEVVVGTKTYKADSLFGKANAGVSSMIDNRRVNNVSIEEDGAVTFLLQRKKADASEVVDTSDALKKAMSKFRAVKADSE